jgi:hypothetical protein
MPYKVTDSNQRAVCGLGVRSFRSQESHQREEELIPDSRVQRR